MKDESTPRSETPLYLLSALVQKDEAMAAIEALVEKTGGVIKKTENLGSKQLAFAINKHRQLILVSVFFEAEPGQLPAIQTAVRQAALCERFLLTTWAADPNQKPSRTGAKKRSYQATEM